MSVEDFLDSNLFIYALDRADHRKQQIARDVIDRAIAEGSACLSFQVVQETLNVIIRKAEIPLAPDQVRAFLRSTLVPLWRVVPTAALYERALDIQARYQYAFYDSLIIAAALTAGCKRILSEDLQHGQRIEGLTIENPFLR
jgi:predicted nucleic acid-binding protein